MQVHKDIIDGKCKMVDCNYTSDNISIGNNVRIHPQAELIGPLYIGDNVSIDEKAVVSHSVIGNNVHISAESRVNGSILWNDITISRKVRLMDSIIMSNSIILKNINLLNTVYSLDINPLYKIRQAT
ncbi:MAG TPA: hypothetical protein VIK78_15655 [Ruminiclostridium sp.]